MYKILSNKNGSYILKNYTLLFFFKHVKMKLYIKTTHSLTSTRNARAESKNNLQSNTNQGTNA